MTKKSEVKTRKGQLIHTFGPGAMQVNKNGVSMIACGLDYWFTESGTKEKLSELVISKFTINDTRLAKKLGVKNFRNPPDHTIIDNGSKINSPLPALRFPYWHICSNTGCQKMHQVSPHNEEETKCPACNALMYQSRFISVCPDGHIQDFPWFEWLNARNNSECNESTCTLKLSGTGSSSSSGINVKCDTHDSRRVSLTGVFQFDKVRGTSTLSNNGIVCQGSTPWLGYGNAQPCCKPLVAALRQATNVYFAKTDTSILIPISSDDRDRSIEEAYEKMLASSREKMEAAADIGVKVAIFSVALEGRYCDAELESFLVKREEKDIKLEVVSEVNYRYQEYQHLLQESREGVLVTRPLQVDLFENWFSKYFSSVTQVKGLEITNAFYGFDRMQPQSGRYVESYKSDLWNEPSSDWLPAVKVYGEGLFIQFRSDKITTWAEKFSSKNAFISLAEKTSASPLFESIGMLSPEYLLVHTFSHLLINQLIFDCGYSTASLRERLYVSKAEETQMYGLLIYTAAGDSEGSLGGLVRMANAGNFEPVVRKAIESSNWCGSDPVCREVGGQGPGGMNLAACHNCALLPETSCELFNSLLDRGAITSSDLSGDGYFDLLLRE